MKEGRIVSFVLFGGFIVLIVWMIGNMIDSRPSVMESASGTTVQQSQSRDPGTVPWDYIIEEGTVGDLIGGDMVILPTNQLLPNDNNYATGDKIWTLQSMEATMTTRADGSNEVRLSAWKPIKSTKSKEALEQDLKNLKVQIETEVDLVGVYKTEYEGKYRQFAVITLPSGNDVKQPITTERYKEFKDKNEVMVVLEEVHDYANYDLAMSKFRGWVE